MTRDRRFVLSQSPVLRDGPGRECPLKRERDIFFFPLSELGRCSDESDTDVSQLCPRNDAWDGGGTVNRRTTKG